MMIHIETSSGAMPSPGKSRRLHQPTHRRPVAFVLAHLIALGLLSGCQIGGAGAFVQGDTPEENNARYTGEPVTGDWIVMDLLDEPESLNPYTSTSASASNIYRYIYESFLEYRHQPPWDFVPLLVESLPEASKDHLTYTWTLRPDVKWHDNRPMTPEDIVFSLKAIMDPYVDDLPSKPYYRELDSLHIDGRKITMFCSKPYFMHIDFLGGFNVLPKHIFDPDGLLDDVSYFQVKIGSAFGRIADLLASGDDVSWAELRASVALAALKKSVKSLSENTISWQEVVETVGEIPGEAADAKLNRITAFLDTLPHGISASRFARETFESTGKALGTLPITAEIAARAQPGTFPLRDSLQAVCRRLSDRIETFGRHFNTHPQGRAPTVGSGPYRFDHWTTGQEIVLTRNRDYWRGEGHAYLDKLVFRVLTDPTAALVALKNGEIDFMENLRTIQYLTMTNRKKFLNNFVKSTFLIPTYNYLGWRCSHPIFKDPRVRRAMTHMVRRRDILKNLLFGFGRIVTGPFYIYGLDYDSTIVPYEYDPIEAQRLLSEAGWADVDNDGILEKDSLEFRFEMLIPSVSTTAEQVTSILREDLFMIGIEMNIRRLEWSVFINNYIRNHNFDACYLGWVFGMKGDPKQVWHSESATGRGSNHIQYVNPEVDSLIDAARVEFDQAKRVKMYHRFQRILHQDQPYTFMFSAMSKPAYDKRFKGVKWYPFRPGYQLNEWFVPREEQKYTTEETRREVTRNYASR